MQVYNVRWSYDTQLGKLGRIKDSLKFFDIVILCRSRAQALSAFEILFHRAHLNDGINAEDGTIFIKRCSVDSRNIFANYLMLDGMKEPLYLTDVSSRHNNFHNIFGLAKF